MEKSELAECQSVGCRRSRGKSGAEFPKRPVSRENIMIHCINVHLKSGDKLFPSQTASNLIYKESSAES